MAVMDTHIRWKVKRRIRDAQITLAVILLFVTSRASSGKKMRRLDLKKTPLFSLVTVDHCDVRPSSLNSSLCSNVFSPRQWDLSVSAGFFFWLLEKAPCSVCVVHMEEKLVCKSLLSPYLQSDMDEVVKGRSQRIFNPEIHTVLFCSPEQWDLSKFLLKGAAFWRERKNLFCVIYMERKLVCKILQPPYPQTDMD